MFFTPVITGHGQPAQITTDRAHAFVRVVSEFLPAALHDNTQYANNRVEADHGCLMARLRLMRGLKRDRTTSVVLRDMPSSRTCGEVTANSGSMRVADCPLPQRSTSSRR